MCVCASACACACTRHSMLYYVVYSGAPNIGRRSLKTRLLNEYPSRFAEVKARKLGI